ncbi:hypothetical protein GUJ93_ZPchr0016g2566 [Zizania palustris]|uniref:Uncharacterized protein n=1 Tax=Zizania palustris TaxID=103762 RepID=A0A8J5SYZ1_ZIZPA|nr:hypothetical protein GUJ93_ZPchr0016g2566 [Zizania palustris]
MPQSVCWMDPMLLEASQLTTNTIPQAGGTEGPTVEPTEKDSDDLGAKLDDFLASLSMALPQALVPTPPKKLATYFKQQLSPYVVRAIRDLVEAGEGNPAPTAGLNGPPHGQTISQPN